MLADTHLKYELARLRSKTRKQDEEAVREAKKILKQGLLDGKKILENLPLYQNTFTVIDEEGLDPDEIFTINELKKIATIYRLKFLGHTLYKPEIPYTAGLKIQYLNDTCHKEIKEYKILAPHNSFVNATHPEESMLFVQTNYDNYYLVHSWGKPVKANRQFFYLPIRNFESLVITIFIITLLITLSIPTKLITLDHKAEYWSGYRIAAFFHLLIFNSGVTVYFTFAFAKNFSSSVWNRYKDF